MTAYSLLGLFLGIQASHCVREKQYKLLVLNLLIIGTVVLGVWTKWAPLL